MANHGARIGKVKIGDAEYPVFCSSTGTFRILNCPADQEIPDEVEPLAQNATTLESAKSSAQATLRKRRVKVEVPFRFHDGRTGIAYGIHAGNGDVLTRDENGDAARVSSYYGGWSRGGQGSHTRGVFIADIPEERVERFKKIHEEIATLQAEAAEIEQWFAIDLKALINEAIAAKLDDTPEPPIDTTNQED